MRLGMLSAAAGLLSILFAATSARADAAKDIDRWSTSCSPGLTCALRYEDPDPGELGAIRFIRAGALDAETEFRLPKPMRLDKTPDADGLFRLSVDGKEIVSLAVRQLQLEGGPDEYVTTDRAIVKVLLDAMKAGKVLRLDYQGIAGTHGSEITLEGFRGSLFYMDDVQDRRGRTDALFAVGKRVPEGLGSKDIQSLDDIPAAIRADFTAKDGNCAEAFYPEDISRYSGFDISRDSTRLVLVPCSSGGAYNQPYALYRGFETGPLTRISFPEVVEGKPSITETADNVDFDPVTGIMTAFLKDNSMSACGLWHKWRLTGEGELVLLERRGWYECDGTYEGPEDFPLEWPVDGQPQQQTSSPDEE